MRTLGLVSLRVLGRSLLLSVESEVLEQEDLSVRSSLDGLLGLLTNTVGEESDRGGEERLELGSLCSDQHQRKKTCGQTGSLGRGLS